ncbi:MAG: hypothetical protein K6F45_09135 [Saccharofermentans sp.]|nr:hypothetical protein [Saccharofermentans sp.]
MRYDKDKKYISGESLSETLVASLIISLAMIMLFSGTKVGTNIVQKSHAEYQEYFDKINAYEEDQAEYIKEYCVRPELVDFGMEPHKHDWDRT